MMPLLRNQTESGLLIDTSRSMKRTLRPQSDFSVTNLPRESHAFFHQSLPDSKSTSAWFNQKQAQFGDGLRVFHQKYRADDLSIFFGDPATLPFGIKILNELRDNLRDQSLKMLIVAIFLSVEHSVPMNHPTYVSRLVGAK